MCISPLISEMVTTVKNADMINEDFFQTILFRNVTFVLIYEGSSDEKLERTPIFPEAPLTGM